MLIHFDESPVGSGKTDRQEKEVTKSPTKVLFIVERIARFDEIRRNLKKFAAIQGTSPTIVTIRHDLRDRSNSVSQRVEALPSYYWLASHVIVLATHAAMLRSDFSGFAGWQIIVDEVPNFLDFEQKCTHLDQAFFKDFYKLEPNEGGWCTVEPTEAGSLLTAAEVRADDSHRHLAVFHRRVLDASRPGSKRVVLCNLPNWKTMTDKKVQWCWASTFSLWELEAFDRVTLLGSRFRANIGSIISESLDVEPVEWIALPTLKGIREFHRRAVHIHYFSENRAASRTLFESDAGQEMLSAIGAHLSRELSGIEFIWTANDPKDDEAYALGAISPAQILKSNILNDHNYLSPRQAGTNAHLQKSHAVAIYSAKPAPNLISLLKIRGIPTQAWTRSVEHEAILQFVTRTSIRDAGNSSPVHIWVFDRHQALYLKEYFDGLDYVVASMALVENGPEIPTKEKRGPKAALRTPEEQAAYDAERRRRDAERNKRNRRLKKMKKAA